MQIMNVLIQQWPLDQIQYMHMVMGMTLRSPARAYFVRYVLSLMAPQYLDKTFDSILCHQIICCLSNEEVHLKHLDPPRKGTKCCLDFNSDLDSNLDSDSNNDENEAAMIWLKTCSSPSSYMAIGSVVSMQQKQGCQHCKTLPELKYGMWEKFLLVQQDFNSQYCEEWPHAYLQPSEATEGEQGLGNISLADIMDLQHVGIYSEDYTRLCDVFCGKSARIPPDFWLPKVTPGYPGFNPYSGN
ncbi:hypothetical protein BDV93DRAFT_506422 [Ceratobasidium sp. AG-I]|nr:hypothetical protein BDV93DRAFT_506422 [Ceratobasidium sp. AG-I]